MSRSRSYTFALLALAGILLLSACNIIPATSGNGAAATQAPAASTTPTAYTPTPIGTPTETGTAGPTAIQVTVVPVGTGSPMPGEVTVTPAATQGAGDQSQSVTLAEDGKTITLKVGQRFLLNLGEGFNWSPVVADQSIVSRVPNISVIRGAQGIYEAHAAGTTTLNADGEPACRQSKPACALPNRAFKVTLVVQP